MLLMLILSAQFPIRSSFLRRNPIDTPLRDIPQSIQVIPRELLEDQQINRLDEALRNLSGVM